MIRSRPLGALTVPPVGVGCNQLGVTVDGPDTERVVRAALDAGATLFDTADEYGAGRSEELLGAALRGRRDEAVIATKVGCVMPGEPGSGGAGPPWIRRAVEASLRRLGTDRIDLYQVHYPDPSVPVADTLGTLDELRREGKVLEIGCCNLTAEQLEASAPADPHGVGFASAQTHLNVIRRRALCDVVPACEKLGIGVLPYWPLASGLLTGKYRPGVAPVPGSRLDRYPEAADALLHQRNLDRVAALQAVAHQTGRTLLELAVGWLLAQPAVSCVIAGATRPDQPPANVAAVVELGVDELMEIEAAYR